MTGKIPEQRIEQSWQAWKGTVLMVGLTALLMLLSGCYTMLATSSSGSLTDRYILEDYEASYEDPGEYYAVEGPGFAAQQQAVESYGVESYEAEATQGVGVRYRDYEYYEEAMNDYDYYLVDEPQEVVVVDYRRPWVRRLYVDWYYDWAFGWGLHPVRYGRVWSVGWSFAGFGMSYGSYYWYDPFYWDVFWCDPYWSHGYSVVWGWPYYDPWWWGPSYRWWDPWWCWDPWHRSHNWYWSAYYDGWYDGYWYGGGRGSRVVVASNQQRRSDDRRRGLADARTARGGASGRGATGTNTDGNRSGDRTRATTRTPATAPGSPDTRTSRRPTTTGGGGVGGTDTRATTRIPRSQTRPPVTDPAVERARRTIEQGRGVITGGSVIGNRNTRKPGSSTAPGTGTTPRTSTTTPGIPRGTGRVVAGGQKRTTTRTIGGLIGRLTGSSGGSGGSGSTARVRVPPRTTGSSGRTARGTVRIPSVPRTSGGSSARPTIPRTSGGGSVSRPTVPRTTGGGASSRPTRPTGGSKVKVPPPSGGSKSRPTGKGKVKGA